LEVNGNGAEAIIAGTKDHGNNPGKADPTNQDIGKTAKRDTDGKKVAGRNSLIKPC